MKQKEDFYSKLTKTKISGGAFSLAAILPTILSLIVLLALSLLSLTKEGYTTTQWFLYVSYLITPTAFFLIALFFFKKGLIAPKSIFKKTKWKYYLIAILLQLGLFSLSELNSYFLKLLHKLFGYEDPGINLPSLSGFRIVFVILVIAVLPAIFEEIIFRGLILDGIKNYSMVFSVLVCGGLFALYHQNPAQTIYQFVCGVCFALIALKAGSILPTMLSHFLNNAVIIILYKYGIEEFSGGFRIPFLCVSALCLIGTLSYLLFWDKDKKEDLPKLDNTRVEGTKMEFFLFALVGIVICFVVWISSFFS